jgi:hypothetical protein
MIFVLRNLYMNWLVHNAMHDHVYNTRGNIQFLGICTYIRVPPDTARDASLVAVLLFSFRSVSFSQSGRVV